MSWVTHLCQSTDTRICTLTQNVWQLELVSRGLLNCFCCGHTCWFEVSSQNSRLLTIRAHTIIYFNSLSWLTPFLRKSSETPKCYISQLRWKWSSVPAVERMPHSFDLFQETVEDKCLLRHEVSWWIVDMSRNNRTVMPEIYRHKVWMNLHSKPALIIRFPFLFFTYLLPSFRDF